MFVSPYRVRDGSLAIELVAQDADGEHEHEVGEGVVRVRVRGGGVGGGDGGVISDSVSAGGRGCGAERRARRAQGQEGAERQCDMPSGLHRRSPDDR